MGPHIVAASHDILVFCLLSQCLVTPVGFPGVEAMHRPFVRWLSPYIKLSFLDVEQELVRNWWSFLLDTGSASEKATREESQFDGFGPIDSEMVALGVVLSGSC